MDAISINEQKTDTHPDSGKLAAGWKLWLYTNYDCNIRCSYCTARSGPRSPQRPLGFENVVRLVNEAVDLGFEELFLTGGEPFILRDIYQMIAYACQHMDTTVLTNAMLFNKSRLEKLIAVQSDRLRLQVSLDGAAPAQHDAYRGHGTWEKTVAGIRALQSAGFQVRLSTTETPANCDHLAELASFREQQLGIPASAHFIRPLARRGFSNEGVEVDKYTLQPELTVNAAGVYWHPLSTDEDMLVCDGNASLAEAVMAVRDELVALEEGEETCLEKFT